MQHLQVLLLRVRVLHHLKEVLGYVSDGNITYNEAVSGGGFAPCFLLKLAFWLFLVLTQKKCILL